MDRKADIFYIVNVQTEAHRTIQDSLIEFQLYSQRRKLTIN